MSYPARGPRRGIDGKANTAGRQSENACCHDGTTGAAA